MLILFVLAAAYHSHLGVRVVIEDYVPGNGPKVLALVVSAFAHASLTTAAVFAILKIAFGPAA
jgi:succinate dehydrogenase / fumarate reductase membrane anchor subunit